MSKFLTLIVFLFATIAGSAQYERKDTTIVDTFPNGNYKRIVHIEKKNLKKYKLHEYYGDQKVTTKLYDSTGTLLHERVRWHKKASYGKPCREVIWKHKTYWPNGKIKSSYASKCDCHKVIYKRYNKKGKLLRKEKSVIRRQEGISDEQRKGEEVIIE